MWNLSHLLAEQARNFRALHVPLLLVVSLVLFGAGDFERGSIQTLRDDFDRWVESGGMLFSVEAGDAGIKGSECDRVQNWRSVRSAGAVGLAAGETPLLQFDRSPGVDYSAVSISPGFVRSFAIQSGDMPGWILGPTAARELGVDPGRGYLGSQLASGPVVGQLEPVQRPLGYDRAVGLVRPGIETRFAVCWVELDPVAYPDGQQIIQAMFSEMAQVRPFVRIDESDHPAARYEARATRNSGLVGSGAIALIWSAWWWLRRRELILYRTLQVTRAGVFLLLMTEALLILVVATFVAIAGLAVLGSNEAATEVAVWTSTLAATVGLGVSTLTALLLSRRNVATGSKDL